MLNNVEDQVERYGLEWGVVWLERIKFLRDWRVGVVVEYYFSIFKFLV